METGNPVDGYFAVNFRRSGIIVYKMRSYGGVKSQDVKNIVRNICVFWKNDTIQ